MVEGKEKLVCDSCGDIPSRKRKCPYGWCVPASLCNKCFATIRDKLEEMHAECKQRSINFNLRIKDRQDLMDRGFYLRTSALSHGNFVKVIFVNKEGERKAYWMDKGTYRSFGLLDNLTPVDFAKRGYIEECKNTILHDPEDKDKPGIKV
jgi:hypothetical protein